MMHLRPMVQAPVEIVKPPDGTDPFSNIVQWASTMSVLARQVGERLSATTSLQDPLRHFNLYQMEQEPTEEEHLSLSLVLDQIEDLT